MVSEHFESWAEMWDRQRIEKGVRKGLQQNLNANAMACCAWLEWNIMKVLNFIGLA